MFFFFSFYSFDFSLVILFIFFPFKFNSPVKKIKNYPPIYFLFLFSSHSFNHYFFISDPFVLRIPWHLVILVAQFITVSDHTITCFCIKVFNVFVSLMSRGKG